MKEGCTYTLHKLVEGGGGSWGYCVYKSITISPKGNLAENSDP